jgi:hypothetical protein
MRSQQIQQLYEAYCPEIGQWIFPIAYLYGEIGTGKSTALQEAMETMQTKNNIVFAELDCVEIKNHSWFLYNVTRQIMRQKLVESKKIPVHSFYSFAEMLKSATEAKQQQIAIVLENIHLLDKKTPGIHQLVTYLLDLHQLTNGNVCVIATSRVPWERFIQGISHSLASSLLLSGYLPLQIYFEQFNNDQVTTILTQLHPQKAYNSDFAKFLKMFVAQVYSYVRNVPEIGRHVTRIFAKFEKAKEKLPGITVKQFQQAQIKAEMKVIMGANAPVSNEEDEDDHMQLSTIQKYLLVAVFIGSRVAAKDDSQYFDRVKGVTKKGRKNTKVTDSAKSKKKLHDVPLNRLLAITQSLMYNQTEEEKKQTWTNLDLTQQVATLCSNHYIERGEKVDKTNPDAIELDSPSFRLSTTGMVSFEIAKKLASNMHILLDQYNIIQ